MDELAGTVAVPRLKRAADAARAVFSAALDLALPRLCAAYREPGRRARALSGLLVQAFLYHTAFCERLGIRLRFGACPWKRSRPARLFTVLAPRFVPTTFPARWGID
jgi:hypothetical protein